MRGVACVRVMHAIHTHTPCICKSVHLSALLLLHRRLTPPPPHPKTAARVAADELALCSRAYKRITAPALAPKLGLPSPAEALEGEPQRDFGSLLIDWLWGGGEIIGWVDRPLTD